MALDDFQMPSFKDPDGTVYIWDPSSSSYVKAPLTDNRPDIGHATGGDNDLFDPFQHTETGGNPMMEGYMAANHEYGVPGYVKCPNCFEDTQEQTCPACGKDLTPEWNTEGQQNEFFDVHHDFNDAKEWRTWPQNVPKKNEFNYDNSFPSMSLSKTAAEEWDDIFADEVPMRAEVGRWILDMKGQLHVGMGQSALHEQIEARDGLRKEDEIALGSVYNDGTGDVQAVTQPSYFDLATTQNLVSQAFGPVTLNPPVSMAEHQQKGTVFPPFEITGGQWIVPPYTEMISGTVWIKERNNGEAYKPNQILVAEHLAAEDIILWERGCAAIVAATGGTSSHAAVIAMQQNIPVIVGIGEGYNKLETGNYVKIDPRLETITVIPGLTGDASSEEKSQVWNDLLLHQHQHEQNYPYVPKPTFSHIIEELDWKAANAPNLEQCPECEAPMMDQDGESVCHDCGHKQPIIIQAGALALAPLVEGLGIGGAAEGAGAAGAAGGGGIGGIGGMMTKALGRGTAFRAGENAMGGGGSGGGGGGAGGAGGGLPGPQADPSVGVVSRRHAAWNQRHAGALSAIFQSLLNSIKSGVGAAGEAAGNAAGTAGGALSRIDPSTLTRLINPLDPVSPLSYVDDAALGGLGQIHQQLQQATSAQTTFGEDEIGAANKNDGTNSTDEASNSGIEGKKEQGDSPEQLKDVDGGRDSQDSNDSDSLEDQQGDPDFQDKALKAFHMNLPLVIEFANSDEPGSENPILQAIDAMLEEAFPGYKDGHDQDGGATHEHPEESDTGEPDQKSEGADKKEAKIASTLHQAWGNPGDNYNDAMEEDPTPKTYVACPNCGHEETYGDFERAENEGRDPYACPKCGEQMSDPRDDLYDDFDADPGPGAYEMYGPDRPSMEDYYRSEREGKLQYFSWDDSDLYPDEEADCPMCGGPGVPLGALGRRQHFRCRNCGMDFSQSRADDPGQGQGMENPYPYDEPDPGYLGKTADMSPAQVPGQSPVPAGTGGPAMQICPRCGQAHPAGTPCPVADVTAPLTTGDPMGDDYNTNKVTTKWKLAVPSNVPSSMPQQNMGAPAAPATCPMCGCNHIPGTPCMTDQQQAPNMANPAATGSNPGPTPPMNPGVAYSATEYDYPRQEQATQCPHCGEGTHTALDGTCQNCGMPIADQSGLPAKIDYRDNQGWAGLTPQEPPPVRFAAEEHEHHHDQDDYHSDDDWKDESGTPLEEGAEYEMKTSASPIPDRVTIEAIRPERLTYIIHSGDVDFRDTITRDQLDLDGASFQTVDYDDTGEDSMDQFSDQEMPPRPGDDALPQVDDLSSPSTVVSAFEPVSLDNYTGSFAGDATDNRNWLIEDSSPVEVDPVLMAKLSGKDYSPREQREFIDETGEARNLDRLDLSGTHYIGEDDLGISDSMW